MPFMSRRPVESDFKVEVFKGSVAVQFLPTRSLYTFARFTAERDIAEFGLVSPDPIEQHLSRAGVRGYNAGELRAMAFRLATAAARAGK
jgi:hypothetical protein